MIVIDGKICDRCGKENEKYEISDCSWNSATDNTEENCLCKSCFKIRMGRPFGEKDLVDAVSFSKTRK